MSGEDLWGQVMTVRDDAKPRVGGRTEPRGGRAYATGTGLAVRVQLTSTTAGRAGDLRVTGPGRRFHRRFQERHILV